VEDKLVVTGQGGQCNSRRRLINGGRCQRKGVGEKKEASSQNSQGNLVEGMDDGRRVSRLKCVDVGALMHDHRVAVGQCERKDRRKNNLEKIGSRIVVVLIHVVDIPRERGELKKNPWSSRGSRASDSQQASSVRIHDF
jgi:hypothetical protein